ncbi:MAG: HlyD family secretion protein, partial [Hyphomicrobiaceae bacterium]|nr:HlyD family secretion protein [Hyphomicrobiaceae bacterium]
MSKRVLRPILLILVPCLAVVGAVMVWLWGGRYVTTENAYVKADIARVSAEVTGRVAEVLIADHTRVKKGDVLVKLDAAPFKIALAKAEAEIDVTRQNVKTLVAQWREAKGELKEAEGQVVYWEAQLKRNRTLARRKIVSATKMEEVANSHRKAKDQVALMRSKVQRMLTQIGSNASAPIDQHPTVRQKIAARNEAALNLKRTIIHAPVDGVAVNVKIQPGEHVVPDKPLFAVVVGSRPWVEANFKETEL